MTIMVGFFAAYLFLNHSGHESIVGSPHRPWLFSRIVLGAHLWEGGVGCDLGGVGTTWCLDFADLSLEH